MKNKKTLLNIWFLCIAYTIPIIANPHYRSAEKPQVVSTYFNEYIETPRLIIRPFTSNDALSLFTVHSNTLAVQFLPFDADQTIEETAKRINRYLFLAHEKKSYFWAVILKETGEIIGRWGLFLIDYPNGSAEVFIMLHPDYWNKGLGSELMHAGCSYVFNHMKLNRIEATAYPENGASIAVCKKIGFDIIGMIKEYVYYKGAYWDRVLMSLTASDFLKHNTHSMNYEVIPFEKDPMLDKIVKK